MIESQLRGQMDDIFGEVEARSRLDEPCRFKWVKDAHYAGRRSLSLIITHMPRQDMDSLWVSWPATMP